jgi:hypothetical protein
MLMSTLPELPGRTFEVRGLVSAEGVLMAVGGDKIKKLMQALAVQAEECGADGIVDVRTVLSGGSPHCVVTGTAVKLL